MYDKMSANRAARLTTALGPFHLDVLVVVRDLPTLPLGVESIDPATPWPTNISVSHPADPRCQVNGLETRTR